MSAVRGLEHVVTRLSDSCGQGHSGSLLEAPSADVLSCSMQAVVYYGVPGDITDVLPRIGEAGIAVWGPQDGEGRDMPHARGTVSYALTYHRDHGRYPDGSLMSTPVLEAAGMRVDWDRPGMPMPSRFEGFVHSCDPDGGHPVYERCSTAPKEPMSMAAARDQYGTVLTFSLGEPGSSAYQYFTVPRRQ
ncbi:hypothetical protein [Streptomyces sp. NPDC004134]|uniref:hypothetical protein n=1 Tax=Streptomyces sp. NPDC004134 TaxID=3364691 RepID=UPI00368FC56E